MWSCSDKQWLEGTWGHERWVALMDWTCGCFIAVCLLLHTWKSFWDGSELGPLLLHCPYIFKGGLSPELLVNFTWEYTEVPTRRLRVTLSHIHTPRASGLSFMPTGTAGSSLHSPMVGPGASRHWKQNFCQACDLHSEPTVSAIESTCLSFKSNLSSSIIFTPGKFSKWT
jgi:hypothetical protein